MHPVREWPGYNKAASRREKLVSARGAAYHTANLCETFSLTGPPQENCMFEWYAGLPRFVKFGVAFLVLAISGVAWAMGYFWPWGWGVGLALLLAAMTISD